MRPETQQVLERHFSTMDSARARLDRAKRRFQDATAEVHAALTELVAATTAVNTLWDEQTRLRNSLADELPLYLTVKQVAQKLAISYSSAYTLIQREEIKGTRIGRAYRVKVSDLQEYMNSGRDR